MKVLAINGSPNSDGSTAILLDKILEICKESGTDCERVNITDFTIDPCQNCNICVDNGECFKDDDFIHMKAKMMDADGIIIGSPYYRGVADVRMRIFLDRIRPQATAKSIFTNKYIIGVSTSAKDNCKKVAKYCASLGKLTLGTSGVVSGLIYVSTIKDNGVVDIESDPQVEANIKKVVNRLFRDINKNHVPLSDRLFRILNKLFFSKFSKVKKNLLKLYKRRISRIIKLPIK